jgi:hypothetical protein
MMNSRARPSAAEPKRSMTLRVPTPTRPHGGRSLDALTQRQMQSRFGQDFSDVRIHTDDEASQSAAMLGTRAYSHGADIAFGNGHYSPNTPDGQRLLAHELAHVAQQRHGGSDTGSEARADTAAQQATRGQEVSPSTLGGAGPGIHCDGGGKDEKKEAPPPKAAPGPRPFVMPLTMLPFQLPQLQPPSMLAPQREPIFSLPQLSLAPQAAPPTPGASLGFDTGTGSQIGKPSLLPPLLPGTTFSSGSGTSGALAPTAPVYNPPLLPQSKNATTSGPDLPSRIGLADFGPFNIGLRMGIPGPKKEVEGTPPDRRAQPPGQIPGSGPSALSISEYQGELLDMSLTGKVPTGFDAVDKGELAKICFSILSTHIAPDLFKSLASKMAGKAGPDLQIDFSLDIGSKAGAVVFTMPLGKPPKVTPRSTP